MDKLGMTQKRYRTQNFIGEENLEELKDGESVIILPNPKSPHGYYGQIQFTKNSSDACVVRKEKRDSDKECHCIVGLFSEDRTKIIYYGVIKQQKLENNP